MRRLEHFSKALALAINASALSLPPGEYAIVTDWSNPQIGAVPEFELEIWAESAVALTSAVLYGARAHDFAFADITISGVDHTQDEFTSVAHGLNTGDGPTYLTTSGTLGTGLSAATKYWVIKTGDDTFKVALSLYDALSGTAVEFSSNGTGTRKIVDSEDEDDLTQRFSWITHDGLLGLAGDGAIALDAGIGYSKRIPHSPRVLAYALSATIDTDTVWATISPIQDR